MDVVTYAIFAYGLTAVISFAVIGIIVLVNHVMNLKTAKEEGENANP